MNSIKIQSIEFLCHSTSGKEVTILSKPLFTHYNISSNEIIIRLLRILRIDTTTIYPIINKLIRSISRQICVVPSIRRYIDSQTFILINSMSNQFFTSRFISKVRSSRYIKETLSQFSIGKVIFLNPSIKVAL